MHLLAPFIAVDRQHSLADGVPLPDRAVGAALFADLSGFTPFTEAITAALGPQLGAEAITARLNLVFEALIAEIHRFGGSVISFSGDAVTCWFDALHNGAPGAPPDIRNATRRAVAAALACQQAIERVNSVPLAPGANARLGLKAAVSTGRTRRFAVGDPQIQLIDVLAGTTLDRLAEAEHLARRGEVLIAAELVADLGDDLLIDDWRADPTSGEWYVVVHSLTGRVEPAPWVPTGPHELREEQMRPWLLPAVYERLQRGQGDFLAELRPAVALFLRFDGIDYDNDEAAGEKLDAFVRHVQRIVSHYEGYLLQLTVGDKGSYLYAAFGAPIAHDDDALRAAATAQALRRLPIELAFISPPQIGLSQGVMYCGPYGAVARRTYSVFGDEVNVAARLMQAARPGQILCTGRVVGLLRQRLAAQSMGGLTVKGKQQPIDLFELGTVAASSRPLPSTETDGELFGRAQERALVAEHLRAVMAGATAAVLLSGEPGIGKTRLLTSLRREALVAGATVLSGASDAIERATPYLAWRPIFAALLDLADAPDDPAARAAFVHARLAFDPDLPPLGPLLNPVLALDLPESELTAQLSGQLRADNTVRLLVALLRHTAARRPLAIYIEDAHWLDSPSLALARAAIEQVRPLLLVLTTRPLDAQPAPELQRIAGHPATTTIALQPLAPADVLALVRRRLGVQRLPEPVGELIVARAEGHPFFSEELVYAMRERSLITVVDGECHITPGVDLARVSFPDTVQGVISSRIDRLPLQHQTALKVASVVGRTFAYRLLADIHPIEDDRRLLPDTLRALEELSFTRMETPEPELHYLFRHVLTREVAYNTLLFAQRRALHRAVAEWYERTFAKDLAPYYAVLAYHWRQALGEEAEPEILRKTCVYLERAGEQAFRTYANQETLALFGELQQLADAHPGLTASATQHARWAGSMAEAALGLGKLEEGRAHFYRALTLLGHPPAATSLALARDLLREVAVQAGHRLWPARFLGRERGRRDELVQIAHLLQQVAKFYYYRSENLPLIDANLRGLNLMERVGEPTPELASLYANFCAISGLIPLHKLAVRYGELAWSTAAQIEHQPTHAWVALATGLYYCSVGGWARAEELLLQALELFERLGDRRQWEESCSVLAPVYFFQGQLERSIELRAAAYASARQRGDQQIQIWGAVGEAEGAQRRGDPEAALALIERVRPLFGENEITLWALGVRATAAWRSGRYAEALRSANAAARLLGRFQPTAVQVLEGYIGLVEVYLGLWERSPAAGRAPALQRNLAAAMGALATFARVFPLGLPGLYRLRGLHAWLRGDPRGAHRHWARSLAEARRLGMPYEEAEAHLAIGRHPRTPADAAHLDAANTILDRIGAVA